MEKFQKYCLSILLVIIYNNISAHVSNGTLESEDCKKLCEVYSKFLGSQQCQQSLVFSVCKNSDHYCTVNQKQKAIHVIGKAFSETGHKTASPDDKSGENYPETEKYNIVLKNFERQGKKYSFAGNIYFKSKVSKIRNKDYLDLKS
ncbi:hypothetical protein [Chryseobacterium populi]|uniref:Uncharacterized protein n=1 Tax=Chryseobacterium populi TaxID=1144316 RepID=J2K0M6_9FLAO|nr:hypothetical protein [Chryseobacterium populi]EJL73695.1 hypothetical protein PMI13_01457 [Chryseobacterium populi]